MPILRTTSHPPSVSNGVSRVNDRRAAASVALDNVASGMANSSNKVMLLRLISQKMVGLDLREHCTFECHKC